MAKEKEVKKEVKKKEITDTKETPMEVKVEKPKVKPSIDGPGVKCDRVQAGGAAEKQLIYYASCPKVRTRIPREGKEPVDAVATVIVNDLRINIRKGVTVEIPEPVAEILDNAYFGEQKALNETTTRNPLTGRETNARIDMKSTADQAQF